LPIADNVRELTIGHAMPGLHQVYDQYAYLDEKRRALELWAMRLRDIVAPPPPADVLPIRKTKSAAMKTAVRKRKRRPRRTFPPWADRYWLLFNSDDPNGLWYEAMDALEQRDNKKPLIEMLLDPKREVTPAVRECLADLLKRHTLVRLRGERQIPIWAISSAEYMFLLMQAQVLKLTENGISQKEAIKRVASSWEVDCNFDEHKLTEAIIGKRGSLQRTLNRLARLTSKEWVHKRAAQITEPGWLMSRLRKSVGIAIDDPGE